jgi:hypothetical protein
MAAFGRLVAFYKSIFGKRSSSDIACIKFWLPLRKAKYSFKSAPKIKNQKRETKKLIVYSQFGNRNCCSS